jgi:SulP family sulfate permease
MLLSLAWLVALAFDNEPESGLAAAAVVGLLASARGGAGYFQINGAVLVFGAVVYGVVSSQGSRGTIEAALAISITLLAFGAGRFEAWTTRIPEPVVVGLAFGVALILVCSLIEILLGLDLRTNASNRFHRWVALWTHPDAIPLASIAVAGWSLATLVFLFLIRSAWPGVMLVFVVASIIARMPVMPAETVGDRLSAISTSYLSLHEPTAGWAHLSQVLSVAITLALLVAARLPRRLPHKPRHEQVAEHSANATSSFKESHTIPFAHRSGAGRHLDARALLAGTRSVVVTGALALAAAPLIAYVPLASIVAVLMLVVYKVGGARRFRQFMGAPTTDRLLLFATFVSTVLVDPAIAIGIGLVLSVVLHTRQTVATVAVRVLPISSVGPTRNRATRCALLPPGVEAVELVGPFVFGVADQLNAFPKFVEKPARAFIVLMRNVPFIDATGAARLVEFVHRCHLNGTVVILAGIVPQVRATLRDLKMLSGNAVTFALGYSHARRLAEALTGDPRRVETGVREPAP